MRFYRLAIILWLVLQCGQAEAEARHSFYLPIVRLGGSDSVVLDWGKASELILTCQPDYIIVFHWFRVEIVLPGDVRLTTYEPGLNATIDLVEASGCNTPVMVQ